MAIIDDESPIFHFAVALIDGDELPLSEIAEVRVAGAVFLVETKAEGQMIDL
jgi:hypothetical protein